MPEDADVSIVVFDIAGRRVATLEQGRESAGTHEVNWNTNGVRGGMYFCRMQVGGVTVTKSLLVMK